MTLNIRLEGLDKLEARMERIVNAMNGADGENTMRKAVTYVHSQVPPESSIPQPAPGAWADWARASNPAIFRAFFAKLNAGEWIKRTGDTLRSLTEKVDPIPGGFMGILGSSRDWAPWVISSERVDTLNAGPQAGIHSGRWFALQEVFERAKPGIVRIYRAWLGELLK